MDHAQYLVDIRAVLDTSVATVPLQTPADVQAYFPPPPIGTLAAKLGEDLKAAILASAETGFTVFELRRCSYAFRLQRALGELDRDYDWVLEKIAYYLPGGKPLVVPTNSKWRDIALLGRALAILENNRMGDVHAMNVTNAIKKMVAKKYVLTLNEGRIDRASPGLGEATKDVSILLEKVGLVEANRRLFHGLGQAVPYDFDQYLIGRNPIQPWQMREPTYPWGFLLNLITKLPDTQPQDDADTAWLEAVGQARDIVAVLDVETYNQFAMITPPAAALPKLLGDFGLHDHLFCIRQWSRKLTPRILNMVFTCVDDAVMKQKCGWTVKEAVKFATTALQSCNAMGPTKITKTKLASTGLHANVLDRLLPYFAHKQGAINPGYDSPLMATKADLMFKPMIELAGNSFLVPAAPVAGPAFYEALRNAVQSALGSTKTNELVGTGTEKIVAELLELRGLKPTHQNATYNSSRSVDAGECDFVLEDASHVVFIECKAKSVTRATMSGEIVDALVDYAASLLKSQVQALRHERLLIDHGNIVFDDGSNLQLQGRSVTRLSVTLLGHGTLQDRFVFSNFAYPVLNSKIGYDPAHKKASTFEGVNQDIADLTAEFVAASNRGQDVWGSTMGAASLSIGELSVLIHESPTVAALVKRIRRHTTFGTTNALLEYRIAKSKNLI